MKMPRRVKEYDGDTLPRISLHRIPPEFEELRNFTYGIFNRWPPRPNPLLVQPVYNWMIIMEQGVLSFPKIKEDLTKPTCIRISFGFVKAILLLLQAQVGYQLKAVYFNKGQPTMTAINIVQRPLVSSISTLLSCIDLSPTEYFFFKTISFDWRLFCWAYVMFARQARNRVESKHLDTIMRTALLCQIHERKIDSELIKKVNALPEHADNFAVGVFSSFEVCLILAQDINSIAYKDVDGFFPRDVNMSAFFNTRLASKIHMVMVNELMVVNSISYRFWQKVVTLFTNLRNTCIPQHPLVR